jgi:hypothetical protein
MTIKRLAICFGVFLCLSICFTSRAEADIKPGIRAGAWFDASGFFIGGDVLAKVANRWYFNPNVEYVFGDGADILAVNFDAHYDLNVKQNIYVWVGGGLAVIHIDPDNPGLDGDTDPGVNLLMGVGFPFGRGNVFYIQPKAILSDHSDFSIGFGVRF